MIVPQAFLRMIWMSFANDLKAMIYPRILAFIRCF